MKTFHVKRVTCIAARSITPAVLESLAEAGVREAYLQRCKQVCLAESSGFFGMFPHTGIHEERSDIIRFYIPPEMLDYVSSGIILAADLQLPGRGSLFAEDAVMTTPDAFTGLPGPDAGMKTADSENTVYPSWRDYSILACIVQRGQGNEIVKAVLDMGLCVPVVSFGQGMGLRNRLGLLRVTVPVDKEIVYLIVPAADASLVEGIAVHKARLDRPGRGIIYRTGIRAAAVNTRVRITYRKHVASIEQLIAAVDELHGSTNWRRLSSGRTDQSWEHSSGLSCLSLVCDEGHVSGYVGAAMDAGAGGATFVQLSHQELSGHGGDGRPQEPGRQFHARETCDLIVPDDMTESIIGLFDKKGLFDGKINGFAEVTRTDKAVTYQPGQASL